MALEDLVSTEGQGEGIRGSVVQKVNSNVSRQTFQESSAQEYARAGVIVEGKHAE